MFGLAAEPFLELLPESETASSNRIKIFQDKTGVFHCSSSNMNPMPINPDIVRQEVQVLKSDFNGRLKQVLFNAMVCMSLLDNAPDYLVGWVRYPKENYVKISSIMTRVRLYH